MKYIRKVKYEINVDEEILEKISRSKSIPVKELSMHDIERYLDVIPNDNLFQNFYIQLKEDRKSILK